MPITRYDNPIVLAAIRTRSGSIQHGKRHTDAYRNAEDAGYTTQDCTEGFLTDDCTFLRRQPAAAHALAIGQITALTHHPTDLYSLDLWPDPIQPTPPAAGPLQCPST
jgi:hypothetical protein